MSTAASGDGAAVETFGLDPLRVTIPPINGLNILYLQSVIREVDAELTAGIPGGRLAAGSLANLLAVRLIRYRRCSTPNGAKARRRAPTRAVPRHRRVHRNFKRLVGVTPGQFQRR